MSTPPRLPATLTDRAAFQLQLALRRAQEMGEQTLVDLGISGREYGVLAVLEGGRSSVQHRIGEALGIDRTTVMTLVSGLADRGLVVREPAPGDRRAYAVRLTGSGEALRRRAARRLAACDRRFLAPLSERQREDLHRLLQLLADAGQAE